MSDGGPIRGEVDGDARELPVSRVNEGTCLSLTCTSVEPPVVTDEGEDSASSIAVSGGLCNDGGPEDERLGVAGRGGFAREGTGVGTEGPESVISTSRTRAGHVSWEALGVAFGLPPPGSDRSGTDCLARCRRIGGPACLDPGSLPLCGLGGLDPLASDRSSSSVGASLVLEEAGLRSFVSRAAVEDVARDNPSPRLLV